MPARVADQTWPTIVEAAYWLSGELRINRTLWARACELMGQEYAAVALALVTTRPAGHFTSGPAGYFAGMLRKYEKGELRLAGTLWALREEKWASGTNRGSAPTPAAKRPILNPFASSFPARSPRLRQRSRLLAPCRHACVSSCVQVVLPVCPHVAVWSVGHAAMW